MAESEEDNIPSGTGDGGLDVPRELPRFPRMAPWAFVAVALFGIFFLYQIVGGGLTLLIFGQSVTTDNVQSMRIATMLSQILFLFVPTVVLMKIQHGSVRDVLPRRMPKASEVVLAVAAVFSLQEVMEGYLFFQDKIPLPESIQPYIETMKRLIEETYRQLVQAHSPAELLFVILVVSITPAICEELLFRGLIQKNIALATSKKTGFVVTGIIFGLYHVDPFLLVPLVSLGILFGFFMFRSETIVLPMVAHFVNNLISTLGLYYENDMKNSPALSMINSLSDYSSTFVVTASLGFAIVFLVSVYFYLQVTETITTANVPS
ncbi:MAG TPA: CPBP family intramembrane glutamic endopeptidase [Bacteroidota bacterium]|nr:CPBP family intramembrane glutamic endopeptidase [Bacteroidota bacterium]